MTTPVWITGFEHGLGTPVTNGTGLFDTVTNSPTIQNTIINSGSYALRFYKTVASSCSIAKNISNSPAIIVGRIYVRVDVEPNGTNHLLAVSNGSTTCNLVWNPTDHKIYSRVGSTALQSSAALTTGKFYRVDFKFDISANPWKLDFCVDGAAATQGTNAQSASTFTYITLGCSYSGTFDIYMDDVVISATSEDYPIGAGAVIGLRPDADGTHNNASNIMENSAGEDIGGTVTAWNLLDDSPFGTAAASDYVRQTGDGTANYCEIQFADTVYSNIQGCQAILQYASETATANNGGCIVTSGTVNTTLWGAIGALSDYSETSAFYKSVIVTPEGGTWTQALVNAVRCRFGYSSDANPDPYWLAIMLEVAVGAESFGTATLTLANFTLSADGTVAAGGTTAYGTADITLATFTLSADGDTTATGTLAKTLDAFTLSGAATTEAKGTLDKTLAAFSLTAAGAQENEGELTRTLANFTIASTATVSNGPTASLIQTLQPFTLSAAGTSIYSGYFDKTLANFTLVSSGNVSAGAAAYGTLDKTIADFTLTSSGTSIISGALDVTLANATLISAGTSIITGGADITAGNFTLDATGTQINEGELTVTLGNATLTAEGVGIALTLGQVIVTLAGANMYAWGVVGKPYKHKFKPKNHVMHNVARNNIVYRRRKW
jgi:hypothetical protein